VTVRGDGLLVPGFVDVHVHARHMAGREDIRAVYAAGLRRRPVTVA
jgi:imidazolonepropionase-like amidohydrolase